MPSFRDQVNNARPTAGAPANNAKTAQKDIDDAAANIERLIRQYILTESRKIPKNQQLHIAGCIKCELFREASNTPNDNMTSVNRNNHNPFVDVRGESHKGGFFGLMFPAYAVHTFTATAAGEQLLDMLRARLGPDCIQLGKWSVTPGSCSAYQFQYSKAGYYPFICGPAEECFPLPVETRDENSSKQVKVRSGAISRTVTAPNSSYHLSLPFSFE